VGSALTKGCAATGSAGAAGAGTSAGEHAINRADATTETIAKRLKGITDRPPVSRKNFIVFNS
jgi:hypothetical protein